ncbi:hypothetical protein QIH97_gp04 [Enterobacter phage KNP3]|nr:hypothetical protein QIH97_gp04 [Enterobacter phage KNP3]
MKWAKQRNSKPLASIPACTHGLPVTPSK